MKAKEILYDILNAHCLSSENTKKVLQLAGISGSIYNGKRPYDQIRRIILRVVSEEKAQCIINQMPFPFIENWSRIEEKHKQWIKTLFPDQYGADTFTFYSKNVLYPLPMIQGYRMENSSGYSEVIVKR